MMTFENVKFHEYLVCKSDNCHIALLFRTPARTDQFDSFHEVGHEAANIKIFCNANLSSHVNINISNLELRFFLDLTFTNLNVPNIIISPSLSRE